MDTDERGCLLDAIAFWLGGLERGWISSDRILGKGTRMNTDERGWISSDRKIAILW